MKYLFLFPLFFPITFAVAQVTSFTINEDRINKPLKDSLESIFKSDQAVRMAVSEAKKAGKPAAYIDSLRAISKLTDQANLIAVKNMIAKYGWLSPQQVGITAAQGLFLVIQHADLATQEYYFPLIKNAEKEGKILSSNVAILEDRINMRNGRKQVYGSQGFTDQLTGKTYIYPLADVDRLEILRKSMGLQPMKDYIKGWDAEAYKKELPVIEQIVIKQQIR